MPYAKAIVPLVVSALLTVLGMMNITGDMTLEQALTLLITAVLVYFVPNKSKVQ